MGSIYEDLLTAVKGAIVALELPGIVANVHVQKLPGVEEEIDTLPLIAVVPAEEPEQNEHVSFEDQLEVVYAIEVVSISRGKRLLGATGNVDPNEDLFRGLDWRQRLRRTFDEPFAIIGLWKLDVRPGQPIDRSKVSQLYDYQPLTIRCHVVEPDHN